MTAAKHAETKTSKASGRRVAYTRISTDRQTIYQSVDSLKAAGCDPIFVDEAISAVAENRPGLQKARDALQPGDTFVVLAIDRAFRSTIEGIVFLDQIQAEGIAFESIYQCIDTKTPEGRKWFIDMVNNAEYERAVISRRTREKMAAAKRRGIHCGRPFALTTRAIKHAHRLINDRSLPLNEVARRKRVSPLTLKRSLQREGLAV